MVRTTIIMLRVLRRSMIIAAILVLLRQFVFAPLTVQAEGTAPEPLPGMLVFQLSSGGPIFSAVADPTSPDGVRFQYLTNGMDPALSPDGKRLAFTRWDHPAHGAAGGVWLMNVDGTGEELVQGGLSQPKSPAWSPDGAHLMISVVQGGRLQPEDKCSSELPSEPLLADADGDYIRTVVEVDGDDVDIKYCYTLLPHPFWGLSVIDVDPLAPFAISQPPHDRFSYTPAWNPGQPWHIVYDGEGGLVSLDIVRQTSWPLTADVNDHAPVFSPDGSRMAISYWQHDHWEVHMLDVSEGRRQRLTATPLTYLVEQRIAGEPQRSWNNAAPAWSPDGAQIAFLTDRTGRWEIWLMESSGSNQKPFFSSNAWAILEEIAGQQLEFSGVGERVLSWK